MGRKLRKTPVTDLAGRVIGYECPDRGIAVLECAKARADAVIASHHYSRKVTRNSCLSLLVTFRGKVEGALQVGYGIRPGIKGGLDPSGVREFDRMWLSDRMPRFSETITISLLVRYLRRAHPGIRHLISYADTSAGHTGTIYRAANFRPCGRVRADFYILPGGERVHPVTMWHRHGTRAWDFLRETYPGIRRAEGFQLRFIYDL